MKEHIFAQTVNKLRDTAIRYHNYGCLRTLLAQVLEDGLEADKKWKEIERTKNESGTN